MNSCQKLMVGFFYGLVRRISFFLVVLENKFIASALVVKKVLILRESAYHPLPLYLVCPKLQWSAHKSVYINLHSPAHARAGSCIKDNILAVLISLVVCDAGTSPYFHSAGPPYFKISTSISACYAWHGICSGK